MRDLRTTSEAARQPDMAGQTKEQEFKVPTRVRELPSPVTMDKNFTTQGANLKSTLKDVDFTPTKVVEPVDPKGHSSAAESVSTSSLSKNPENERKSPSGTSADAAKEVPRKPAKPSADE